MLNKIKNIINSGSERSIQAKMNIIASFANKGIAIIISLLLVPVTINYLNSEQYGIWLTLSSIVAWIAYFDVGLVHGFRNRFSEAMAQQNIQLARKYVSTAYATLTVIFGALLIIFEIINPFINWSAILNVSPALNNTLQTVVFLLLIGVCTSFVLNVCPTMLTADQKPALTAIITTIGQAAALFVIWILTKTTASSMSYIALALSWIPCIVILLVSIYIYSGKYKDVAPSLKYIDRDLIRSLIGLGGKFFVIQISMLLIFQMVNIILSRVLGPESVTEYNIAYKYYSIPLMVFNIVLSPFWSAYTDAYMKKDFDWMKAVQSKLKKIWAIFSIGNILLLAISPFAFQLWLGDSVNISWTVSISMMFYICILSYSNMYMVQLNGIGKVYLQMIIYIVCAFICLPLSYHLCGLLGIPGILIALSAVYLAQSISAQIQLKKLLSGISSGVWNK